MSIIIRQATIADASVLAQLIEIVWPEKTAPHSHVTYSLAALDHATFVADDAGEVAGFVDGFLTVVSNGLRRWEVDTLAVLPNYRGQHLGERLIQASTAFGSQQKAQLARGLVQIDNIASQRSFARCDYTLNATVRLLCVSSELPAVSVDLPPHVCLVPVQTFTYSGLWLEGDMSDEALRAGQTARLKGNWEIVGALIPLAQADGNDAAPAGGYTVVDRYQWWERSL